MTCFAISTFSVPFTRSSHSKIDIVTPLRRPLFHRRPYKRNSKFVAIDSQIPSFNLFPAVQLLADISEVNRGPLFATAFVFFLTFWGSISFVKGSTKERITQASFTLPEPAAPIAKKTSRYLMERSFVLDPEKDDRKGVMTFTGKVRASTSVAAILVAVAASGLWAATYILNFVLPPSLQSDYWGLLTLSSFAIVPWYWKKANRTEYVKVMIEEEEEENVSSTLFVKGHRDEIEELEKHFKWKRNAPIYDDEKTKSQSKISSIASE